MLRLVVLGVIVLQLCFAACGGAEVSIREAQMWVQTRSEHRKYCGPRAGMEACARFGGNPPRFSCRPNASEWSAEVSIELIAVIILRRLGTIMDQREVLDHERAHVADVRTSIVDWVGTLEQQRFATEEDCGMAAASEAKAFQERLHAFLRGSKLRRD